MDPQLKRILEKLARSERTPGLSPGELDYLRTLVGVEPEPAADPPRPLWHWVRRQMFLHKGIFETYFDGEIDPILLDAGAPAESLRGFGAESRRSAPVGGEALRRAIRRHLGTERTGTRSHAARLVGLVGIPEAVSVLVDSLESGREERADWGIPVIAASLEALGMLAHPGARRLAMKYVGHDDFTVRRAAQVASLLDPTPFTKEDFARTIEAKIDARLFAPLVDKFIEGGKLGGLSEEQLEGLLTEIYLDVENASALAELVVSLGWRPMFQKLLAHDNENVRSAMALRVAFTRETWALPYLSARLEEEGDNECKLVLIAALGSLGGAEQPVARARLSSTDPLERVGAIWGLLDRPGAAADIEPLLKDERVEVRRAAGAALALLAPEVVDDHVELKWTELLNEDLWWPWAVPLKVARVKRPQLPVSAEAFSYVSNDAGRWTPALLERAQGLFRQYPHQLIRWLGRSTPETQRARAVALGGLIGGSFLGALEDSLLSSEPWWLVVETGLEVLAVGGSTNPAVLAKIRLALEESPRVSAEALLAATVFSLVGDSEIRKRALRCFPELGSEVEPYLMMSLSAADADLAQGAAEAAAQLRDPQDPYLHDLVRLLSGEARQLSELKNADRLASAAAPKVRIAVAEAAGPGDRALLLQLAVDKDEAVAAAALGALAQNAGEAAWVRKLVLDMTWSEHWRAKEKAVTAMAQIGDPSYLGRLAELTRGDNHALAELAVRGLDRISAEHPELGLIVLDVREPHRVRDRYSLNDRVNYDADQHSEALRMLLLGLDKKKDPAEAARQRGRKVMLTPAGQGASFAPSHLSARGFEQLAMYLKVNYSDADSGTIIAEVGEDAGGEVLSALLQSAQVAATVASWT